MGYQRRVHGDLNFRKAMELGLFVIWAIFKVSILQCSLGSPVNQYKTIKLTCDEKFTDILQEYEHQEYPSNGFLVYCSSCSVTEGFDECDLRVYGTDTYYKESSVCCGAIHSGNITSDGGYVRIFKKESEYDVKSLRKHKNNIHSKNEHDDYYSYYYKKGIEPAKTTLTATEAVTTNMITTDVFKSSTTLETTEKETIKPSTISNNIVPDTPTNFSNNNSNKDEQQIGTTTKENIGSTSHVFTTRKSTVDKKTISTFLPNHKIEKTRNNNEDKFEDKDSNAIPAASTWLYKGIGIGAAAVVVLIIVLFAGKKLYTSRTSLIRAVNKNKSNSQEGCVCYVAMESSTQGLLHDPETCERDCSKKKELQAGVESSDDSLVGDVGCENKCAECTGDHGCQGDKYDF